MEFNRITAPSLKDLFIRQVEDLIISGNLEIGAQLPGERELARQMGVSRTVVNAGIAEMAGKGFLEIRPRIGIFVNDYRRYGKIGTVLSIMTYNGDALRDSEIRSILEIRLAFDRLAVQNMIEMATDAEIDSLAPLLDAIGASANPADCARALYAYHHELSVLTRNTLLPLIYSSFSIPITALWERYCRLYGVVSLYESTKTVYGYLRDRNLAQAIDTVEQHLRDSISGSREIYRE